MLNMLIKASYALIYYINDSGLFQVFIKFVEFLYYIYSTEYVVWHSFTCPK